MIDVSRVSETERRDILAKYVLLAQEVLTNLETLAGNTCIDVRTPSSILVFDKTWSVEVKESDGT